MHSNSLRLSPRATASFGLLLAGVGAHIGAALPGQAIANPATPQSGKTPPAAAPIPKAPEGLPKFLLLVPAGSVEMGLTADMLMNAAAQIISPMKPQPEAAAKISPENMKTALERGARCLGRHKVDVPAFLLAEWPVKCVEYEAYIQQRLKDGVKIRPPFHWWRDGREDHFLSVLPEINKQFPKDKELGAQYYWERHGTELPYQLKDRDGKSIADLPVTYVDYRQANDFAAWYGMRLPTEAEFTRAARGDGAHLWPWGKSPVGDAFTEGGLQQFKLFNSSDKVLKPVGTVPANTGPFGHVDLFAQAWQLTSGLNYGPISGADLFATEWKALQKSKVGALAEKAPVWTDNSVVLKGGSYASGGEPMSMLIDARMKLQPVEVTPIVTFRLAKSLQPGYDLLYSLLRGSYNRAPFALGQDIDLTTQVGAEHYDIGASGFPDGYQAVSFAAVDWLTNDKTLDLPKLLEKSQTTPLLLGSLACTMPLLEPKMPAGHYSLLFRKGGAPKELIDAWKQGQREGGTKGEEAEGDDGGKPKKTDGEDGKGKGKGKKAWREVLARFGITEADLTDKDAGNSPTFVRIGGSQVPIDKDYFLFHDNQGQVPAILPVPDKLSTGNPFPTELAFAADKDGKAIAKFHVAAPLLEKSPKKIVDIRFQITLDRAASAPWRTAQ